MCSFESDFEKVRKRKVKESSGRWYLGIRMEITLEISTAVGEFGFTVNRLISGRFDGGEILFRCLDDVVMGKLTFPTSSHIYLLLSFLLQMRMFVGLFKNIVFNAVFGYDYVKTFSYYNFVYIFLSMF